ncbi:MAG: nucleotide exchange factor GrpE [Dethiobacter sp.]|nr:nucleotide exchange factor GrpE [Dethiobacter sp.]MBS3898130.1 nucleotide exchange factor GrpE [Dethiobacter sp.]
MNEEEKMILAEEDVSFGEPEESRPNQNSADFAELVRLREENAQYFARLQRLQADFDNYRKRVKAEKQEWTAQAVCEIVRELLPVIDNLERALEAGGSAELLLSGVDLVFKQFLSVLNKHGLNTIEACGVQFDPTCHHAIMQLECAEPENMVVEELQKGYRLKERLLRPSMVKVAK